MYCLAFGFEAEVLAYRPLVRCEESWPPNSLKEPLPALGIRLLQLLGPWTYLTRTLLPVQLPLRLRCRVTYAS